MGDRVRPAWLELTKWRVREFLREPEAVFWVFAFPLLLAFALGIAFRNRGDETVRIAVEQGNGAAPLAQVLDSTPNLEVSVLSPDDARDALRAGRIALVVIPGPEAAFRFDSARAESQLARLVTADALQRASGRVDPLAIREIRVTAPGARYIDFLVPGLLGMNIMGTGLWGVGFSIVRTRTRRLLKRLLASPMRKSQFLLGHVFARLVFLGLEAGALLVFGFLVFDVPMRGSLGTLALVIVVGAMTFSGLGILVASRARTIEGVSGLMNLVMVPMWVLSGVFFSSSHFPEVMQPVIQALPLTALNDALRAVLLDGAGLFAVLSALGILAAWGIASFGVALKIFRWS